MHLKSPQHPLVLSVSFSPISEQCPLLVPRRSWTRRIRVPSPAYEIHGVVRRGCTRRNAWSLPYGYFSSIISPFFPFLFVRPRVNLGQHPPFSPSVRPFRRRPDNSCSFTTERSSGQSCSWESQVREFTWMCAYRYPWRFNVPLER